MSPEQETELRAELTQAQANLTRFQEAARFAVAEAYAYGLDAGQRGLEQDFNAEDHLHSMFAAFPPTGVTDLEALMPIYRLHTGQTCTSPALVAETVARLWRDAMALLGHHIVTSERLRVANDRLREENERLRADGRS